MRYNSDGESSLDPEESYLQQQYGHDGYGIEGMPMGAPHSSDFPDPLGNLANPEEAADSLGIAEIIQTALAQLPLREAEVLKYRYGVGGVRPMSQQGVASLLGIGQQHVSRLEKSAELKLLSALDQVPGGSQLKLEMFEEKLRRIQDPAKIMQFAERVA